MTGTHLLDLGNVGRASASHCLPKTQPREAPRMQLSRFRRTGQRRAEIPTIIAKRCHHGGLHHELLYLIQEPCKTNRNDMGTTRLLERMERHEVLKAAKRGHNHGLRSGTEQDPTRQLCEAPSCLECVRDKSPATSPLFWHVEETWSTSLANSSCRSSASMSATSWSTESVNLWRLGL